MTTLPDRDPQPQARAIEIVADAIRILRTRDGIDIPDELIVERARNTVAALEGEFELEPKVPWVADVQASRPNLVVSMLTEYLDVRRQLHESSRRLDALATSCATRRS
jgi:hypothetical protein